MIVDSELTEKLSQYKTIRFNDEVFRATPKSIIDPLAPSRNGGRWIPRDVGAVLYTSCEREGALAEISFHFAQHTPLPSKPLPASYCSDNTKNIALNCCRIRTIGCENE